MDTFCWVFSIKTSNMTHLSCSLSTSSSPCSSSSAVGQPWAWCTWVGWLWRTLTSRKSPSRQNDRITFHSSSLSGYRVFWGNVCVVVLSSDGITRTTPSPGTNSSPLTSTRYGYWFILKQQLLNTVSISVYSIWLFGCVCTMSCISSVISPQSPLLSLVLTEIVHVCFCVCDSSFSQWTWTTPSWRRTDLTSKLTSVSDNGAFAHSAKYNNSEWKPTNRCRVCHTHWIHFQVELEWVYPRINDCMTKNRQPPVY